MRQPIYDDNGKIIGSYDPDFLDKLPDVLYRLAKYQCGECEAEFLMDVRFVKANPVSTMHCPMCMGECEDMAATSDEQSDQLEAWGCAYPNGLTWSQELEWKAKHGEDQNERT